jgi:hypothetical protein
MESWKGERYLALACLLTLLVGVGGGAEARSRSGGDLNEGCRFHEGRSYERGLITNQLLPLQRKKWRSIEKLGRARLKSGEPLYPLLTSLWDWVSNSNHAVYINIDLNKHNDSLRSVAGGFRLKRFDPCGLHHEAMITLYCRTIDRAEASPSGPRTDGLIPFAKLDKTERYLEVLGHELAHAVDILGDLDRARRVSELIERTNDDFRSFVAEKRQDKLPQDLKDRLDRRDEFLVTLESYAASIEVRVWSELVAGRALRVRDD